MLSQRMFKSKVYYYFLKLNQLNNDLKKGNFLLKNTILFSTNSITFFKFTSEYAVVKFHSF